MLTSENCEAPYFFFPARSLCGSKPPLSGQIAPESPPGQSCILSIYIYLLDVFPEVLSVPTSQVPCCQPQCLLSTQPGRGCSDSPSLGIPPANPLFVWVILLLKPCCHICNYTFFFFLWQPEVQFYKQMLLWASLTQLDQRQPFFQAAVSVLHTESEAALHRFLWIAGFLPETLDTLPTKQGVAH